MTHPEAILTVERALAALKIPGEFGGYLEGIEAAGVVANKIGDPWDRLVNDFEASRISPNAYAIKACDMIYQFRKIRKGAA